MAHAHSMKAEKRVYRNLFLEYDYEEREIEERVADAWHQLFEEEESRIYYEAEDEMGYMLDTGNLDVRSEGMSYGMMMAVQMDRQEVFDRLFVPKCEYTDPSYHLPHFYEQFALWAYPEDRASGRKRPRQVVRICESPVIRRPGSRRNMPIMTALLMMSGATDTSSAILTGWRQI